MRKKLAVHGRGRRILCNELKCAAVLREISRDLAMKKDANIQIYRVSQLVSQPFLQ